MSIFDELERLIKDSQNPDKEEYHRLRQDEAREQQRKHFEELSILHADRDSISYDEDRSFSSLDRRLNALTDFDEDDLCMNDSFDDDPLDVDSGLCELDDEDAFSNETNDDPFKDVDFFQNILARKKQADKKTLAIDLSFLDEDDFDDDDFGVGDGYGLEDDDDDDYVEDDDDDEYDDDEDYDDEEECEDEEDDDDEDDDEDDGDADEQDQEDDGKDDNDKDSKDDDVQEIVEESSISKQKDCGTNCAGIQLTNEQREFCKKYLSDYCWDIKQALFDQFEELKDRYSKAFKSREKYDSIIQNEYKLDLAQGLVYLEWLISVFPFEQKTNLDSSYEEKYRFDIAVALISEMASYVIFELNDKQSLETARSFFVRNKKHMGFAFSGVVWERNPYKSIYYIFNFFLYIYDYQSFRYYYQQMISTQKWFDDKSDLDEFWCAIINMDMNSEKEKSASAFEESISDETYEFFLEMIGNRGDELPRARRLLKELAPEHSVDFLEIEIEEIDKEIKGLYHKREKLVKRLERRLK